MAAGRNDGNERGKGAVGTPAKLIEIAAQRQQRALRGLAAAHRVFDANGRNKGKMGSGLAK